jgi:predicted NodU family carbamoyl transferase
MNTSFNLAGETLVETPEDAFETFNKSDIDYLYFADLERLY